jgi:hypothetical protein
MAAYFHKKITCGFEPGDLLNNLDAGGGSDRAMISVSLETR